TSTIAEICCSASSDKKTSSVCVEWPMVKSSAEDIRRSLLEGCFGQRAGNPTQPGRREVANGQTPRVEVAACGRVEWTSLFFDYLTVRPRRQDAPPVGLATAQPY